MPWANSYLAQLQGYADEKLTALEAAYELSEKTLAHLSSLVGTEIPEEVSFVAFGSLGRKEYNSGSDLDWALVVDGRADAGHRELEREMRDILHQSGAFGTPNPAGAFGALMFSHEVIHCIGGMNDTNANLTRRLLLLLESTETSPQSPLSPRVRLMRGVLQRYFEEEAHFPGKEEFFPRFFSNDVVRYWRTIGVDYAAKNNERGPAGWALRNAKLRFSRKLLYIAGLLLTYETTLFPESDLLPGDGDHPSLPFDLEKPELSSTEHCFHALKLTPLELLARACVKLNLPKTEVAAIFRNYDHFLQILDSEDKRAVLAELTFEGSEKNGVFQEIRELGHEFQSALDALFLRRDTLLGDLTLKYAVF